MPSVIDSGNDGKGELAACLLAVAERRDREAFGRLFAFYAPRAKAYFRALGADGAAAERLAEEAMLVVWREADRFDPRRDELATWMFAVVRNLGVAALRRVPRPDFDPGDPALVRESYNVAEPGPERVGRAVTATVEQLPDDEMKLLRTLYQGPTTEPALPPAAGEPEVAGGGGRLRRVLAKLRGVLGGEGG